MVFDMVFGELQLCCRYVPLHNSCSSSYHVTLRDSLCMFKATNIAMLTNLLK